MPKIWTDEQYADAIREIYTEDKARPDYLIPKGYLPSSVHSVQRGSDEIPIGKWLRLIRSDSDTRIIGPAVLAELQKVDIPLVPRRDGGWKIASDVPAVLSPDKARLDRLNADAIRMFYDPDGKFPYHPGVLPSSDTTIEVDDLGTPVRVGLGRRLQDLRGGGSARMGIKEEGALRAVRIDLALREDKTGWMIDPKVPLASTMAPGVLSLRRRVEEVQREAAAVAAQQEGVWAVQQQAFLHAPHPSAGQPPWQLGSTPGMEPGGYPAAAGGGVAVPGEWWRGGVVDPPSVAPVPIAQQPTGQSQSVGQPGMSSGGFAVPAVAGRPAPTPYVSSLAGAMGFPSSRVSVPSEGPSRPVAAAPAPAPVRAPVAVRVSGSGPSGGVVSSSGESSTDTAGVRLAAASVAGHSSGLYRSSLTTALGPVAPSASQQPPAPAAAARAAAPTPTSTLPYMPASVPGPASPGPVRVPASASVPVASAAARHYPVAPAPTSDDELRRWAQSNANDPVFQARLRKYRVDVEDKLILRAIDNKLLPVLSEARSGRPWEWHNPASLSMLRNWKAQDEARAGTASATASTPYQQQRSYRSSGQGPHGPAH